MFLRPLDYESPLEMPTSQFDKAFALLEQSFKDASFLQAYKALPSRQTTEKAESPTQVAFSDDDDDSDYSDADMHEGYRPRDAPSISLMRRNSTLPPTPPTQSRNASATHAHLVPLPGDKAGTNTPPNPQRPPTPDLTPPNPRTKELAPPRPTMPHAASSRAESFMTAKETQSQASASTSQASLPLRSEAGHKWLDATRGVRLGGLQLGVADRQKQLRDSMSESGDTTPTQETHLAFPAPPTTSSNLVEYITPEDLDREASSTPESEAGNFMRNVTIRKRRTGDQQQTTPSQNIPTGSHKRSKTAVMPLSEGIDEGPSTVKDGEHFEWPETANDHLYRHMRNEKSKRLSSASTTSTVIEAFVLAGPAQQKQPALRRVSRVDTLRDDASSRRSSVESQHVIKHRVSPLPGRKHLVNGDTDAARSASNPETGRISKVPVIVIPERRSSRSSELSDKMHLLTSQQNRLHRPKNHISLKQDYNEGETPRASLDQQANLHNNSDIWLDYASPDHSQDQRRTRLRHVSAPVRTDANSMKTSPKEAFRRLNGQDAKINLNSKQGWKRHSLDAELESPELERPRKASVEQSQSIDHRLLLPSQQRNSSTHALFDYPLQSSPRKSSDAKDIRHLHSSTSPFSQLSDRTDSMELNEAKAINLYPHENKSLLMVQHIAKKRLAEAQSLHGDRHIDALTTPDSEDEGVKQNSHPTFHAVIDTPTPPNMEQDREDVDSPLRNPRAAPQPPRLPAVIISPATPSSQFRKTPTPRSPSPPSRRPSLVEKARRYSETLILPFLPSSSSRRNSVSSQRPKSSEDRDTTLHPFWRPRGFWDDFTDSEEEYSDDELPAGGDTSDIRSLESVEEQQQKGMQGWRAKRLSVRLPGFRGNGGFMLGNSLGIDRHGTNVRRHHVNPPTTKTLSTRNMDGQRQGLLTRLFTFPSLRKRKSTDLLRAAAQSTESLRRLSQRHKRRRNWKWDMGLRNTMVKRRERREEMQREKYREGIKGRIGAPVLLK